MEFTGERAIPGQVDPDLWNEHLSRYAFAALFAQRLLSGRGVAPDGRLQSTMVPGAAAAGADPAPAVFRVLDAGCGSGYGAAQLAGLDPALQVVGIDLSEEALAYARPRYGGPNLHFAHGDCLALEFADGEFDLVMAFEVLEHLTEPAAFLQQARRVLRPSGHLLVSTPNRRYYSEERRYVNPFHTREYDASEFDSLLGGFFPERVIFTQNHAPAIAFFPSDGTLPCSTEGDNGAVARFAAPPEAADQAHFLVVVCARQPGPVPEPFVFVPSAGNVLREREQDAERLNLELEHARQLLEARQQELEERTAWARELDQEREQDAERLNLELEHARQLLEARQQELEERTAWARELDQEREQDAERLNLELEHARQLLEARQQELEERTAWARELDQERERLAGIVRELQADLENKVSWARSLEADLERAREAMGELHREFEERTAWARELDQERERLAGIVRELQADLENKVSWARSLEADLERAREAMGELHREFEERTAWALKLDAELKAAGADLRLLFGSRWYRAGKKFRLSPVPPSDQERGGGP